ncbi:MAG: cell division protein FtsA [Fimbriimonadaceae bacterium]|nr:cell division protein FtsA [Fimbriimonadaceae bacterium]
MTFVAAVDIGTRHVTCVVGSGDKRLRLEGAARTEFGGFDKGVLRPDAGLADAVQSAVSQAARQADRKVTELAVAIGGNDVECFEGQGIKMIIPKGRQIMPQDVLEVINHSRSILLPSNATVIHVVPKTFKVDGQRGIQRPLEMAGSKLEVETLIATGNASALGAIEAEIEAAGFRVRQFAFGPIVGGLGVLSQEEVERGTLMIDLGESRIEFAVFVEGSVAYARSLPLGSAFISRDIALLFKTTAEEAERVKRTAGHAASAEVGEHETTDVMRADEDFYRQLQRRVLAEVIESRVREMVKFVRADLEATRYLRFATGIVLTGEGSRLPGLETVVRSAFDLTVRSDVPTRGSAAAIGLARFALQSGEELGPAQASEGWKDRVRRWIKRTG